MRFDSVVFSDTAHLAALSCFSRLRSERASGHRTLVIPLVDTSGAGVIENRGLGLVRTLAQLEAEGVSTEPARPWRERIAVLIRALGPKHVLAPLGLLGAPQSIDYFGVVRGAMAVDKGRDLLFFEERPHAQVPEALPLRLGALGVRLPPASRLLSPRGYWRFVLRAIPGSGFPPIFGRLGDRFRMARALKRSFREVKEWDAHRALGPKLQPVIEPWSPEETAELFVLAAEMGREDGLGSRKAFNRRMVRHASSAGLRAPIERYWLSLSNADQKDPADD